MTLVKVLVAAFALLALCSVVSAECDILSFGEMNCKESRTGELRPFSDLQKSSIEKFAGKSYKSLKAISFKAQRVAGILYFIKVEATETDDTKSIIHVKFWKPLNLSPERVLKVRTDVTDTDPIVHF